MRNNQDYAPKPGDVQATGFAFAVAGGILAAIGVFIFTIEALNSADTSVLLMSAFAAVIGLFVIIAGYVKRAAEAATALYLLNYQEVTNSSSEELDAPQA